MLGAQLAEVDQVLADFHLEIKRQPPKKSGAGLLYFNRTFSSMNTEINVGTGEGIKITCSGNLQFMKIYLQPVIPDFGRRILPYAQPRISNKTDIGIYLGLGFGSAIAENHNCRRSRKDNKLIHIILLLIKLLPTRCHWGPMPQRNRI